MNRWVDNEQIKIHLYTNSAIEDNFHRFSRRMGLTKAKVPGVLKSHNGAPEEGLMTLWGPCFLPHLPPAWLSLQVSISPPPGPC